MKIKYVALAGIAGIAAALYYLKVRKAANTGKGQVRVNKESVRGEKHIREIMKRSKLAS